MWQRLRFINRRSNEFTQLILDCQDWWNNNCIYLSANARAAFKKAYLAAEYLSLPISMQAGPEAAKRDVNDLNRAGEVILQGVYLPSIGEDEAERLGNHSKKKGTRQSNPMSRRNDKSR